eukprot:1195032-Prorocentrum_minimum.AAC.2
MLECENDVRTARVVKGRVEKTTLGQVRRQPTTRAPATARRTDRPHSATALRDRPNQEVGSRYCRVTTSGEVRAPKR